MEYQLVPMDRSHLAAVAALEEHPGMTNDQFLALVTAAATQAIQ